MPININQNISKYTWMKTGGIAKKFFKANSEIELLDFLQTNNEKYFVLGNGSNVVVNDGIIDTIPIKLSKNFCIYEIDKNTVTLGSATLNFNVVEKCLNDGLSGLEFLVGIPGSVGGGVFMNAGAIGSEIKDFLNYIDLITPNLKKIRLYRKEINMEYRKSNIPEGSIILSANFNLYKDSYENIQNKINKAIKHRNDNQPVGIKTAGSTFKNPPNTNAWKLIDGVGMRGYQIGGAKFSDKHCNFIENLGNATSKDIIELGELAIKKVFDKFGIKLEWEIKIY